jgi:hypothetical protein
MVADFRDTLQLRLLIHMKDSLGEIQKVSISRSRMPQAESSMSAKIWTISIRMWRRLCLTREDGCYKKEPCHVGLSISVQITHIGNVVEECTAKT